MTKNGDQTDHEVEENLLKLNENGEVPRAISRAAAPGCCEEQGCVIAAAACVV